MYCVISIITGVVLLKQFFDPSTDTVLLLRFFCVGEFKSEVGKLISSILHPGKDIFGLSIFPMPAGNFPVPQVKIRTLMMECNIKVNEMD